MTSTINLRPQGGDIEGFGEHLFYPVLLSLFDKLSPLCIVCNHDYPRAVKMSLNKPSKIETQPVWQVMIQGYEVIAIGFKVGTSHYAGRGCINYASRFCQDFFDEVSYLRVILDNQDSQDILPSSAKSQVSEDSEAR